MAHLSASSGGLLPPSGKTCINAAFTYIVLKLHYFDSTDSNRALIYYNLMDVLVNKCLLTHPAEKTYFFLSECFCPLILYVLSQLSLPDTPLFLAQFYLY